MNRPELVCLDCGRRFWGDFTRRRHFLRKGERDVCRSDTELRRIGLRVNASGVWVRIDSPANRQLRLFPLRRGRPRRAPQILRGYRSGAVGRRRWAKTQEPLPGILEVAERLNGKAA